MKSGGDAVQSSSLLHYALVLPHPRRELRDRFAQHPDPAVRPGGSSSSTRTGAPRTTCRSGRSTCWPTRCCASRCALEHVKPRLLGHWGTTPGLNFIYVHMNRVIREQDVDAIYVTGPGHGGPGLVANTWLEGSYSEVYHHVGQDEEGMRRLFRQFSFPGGIPSHVAPETPGSIHEGGELGYALAHAYGAAFDNPDLVVCARRRRRRGRDRAARGAAGTRTSSSTRAATARCCRSCTSTATRSPTRRCSARIPHDELEALLRGLRLQAVLRRGRRPAADAPADGRDARRGARRDPRHPAGGARRRRHRAAPLADDRAASRRRAGPGPKEVDGKPTEGTWRAHQVPLSGLAENPDHLRQLEEWLRSYRPEELFDDDGAPRAGAARRCAPRGDRRMGANPHANGGLLLQEPRAARLPRATRSRCRARRR